MSGLTQDDWPQFAANRHTPPGSQFRIGTRDVFVDLPNQLLNAAISRVHWIERAHDTPESAFEEVQNKLDEINQIFRGPMTGLADTECEWIQLDVRELSMANKPYNIQVRVDWDELLKYLDTVATLESSSITEIYQYIFNSRNLNLVPDSEYEWITEKEQEKVRRFASTEIESIQNHLSDLQTLVIRISNECREKQFTQLYYLYSKDCVHSLKYIQELALDGRITSCYRELRNLIEEFVVAIFYDLLYLKEREIAEPYSIQYPEDQWFNRARSKKKILRNMHDLKTDFADFTQSLYGYSRGKKSQKELWNMVVEHLNSSLLTAAASTDHRLYDEAISGDFKDEVVSRATETTQNILRQLSSKENLAQEEHDFAEELVNKLVPDGDEIWIKFPTGYFARQFVDKYFAEDFNSRYNRYSHFSHAYPDSWQIAPSSSILEYKLFHRELTQAADNIKFTLLEFEDLL